MLNPKASKKEIIQEVLSLIKRAAVDKKQPMHFMILGSINNKIPELRYVVWRSFDVQNLSGHIYTDLRSHKVNQLLENPLAQLLFYDPGKKIQLKVNVEVIIHRDTGTAQKIYNQMQRGMEAYNSLEAPGTIGDNFEETHKMKAIYNADDFVVLETKFLSMEVLQLQQPNHVRFTYNFTKDKFEWLVP
jgi:hypothetical protein